MDERRAEGRLPRRTDTDLRARNLRTVLALGALFLLPIAAAFVLYYGAGWSPGTHVNHGELIEPPRPLPSVSLPGPHGNVMVPQALAGRWALVYLGDGRCDQACRFALYVMRDTRLDLGNDMSRVQRIFLVTSSCCDRASLARAHRGLIVLDASGNSARKLIDSFPLTDQRATIFVVDPLGNLMMRYDSRRDPVGLLQDLQTLLRLSHIG
jgi:cytochrome oxidase Cu insertion factor (SCO1/SenC/PrrC family)